MLTGSQLVKKFPEFYGTRGFITSLTVPAICPYLEAYQLGPRPPISLPEDLF
jgi:hypothetical protein